MKKYTVDLEVKDGSWCGANEFNSLEEARKCFESEVNDSSNKKHYASVCLNKVSTKFYVDKQYQDSVFKDTYYSYEQEPDMYFETEAEAEAYANKMNYRLEENEMFVICETEEEYEVLDSYYFE